MPNIILVGYGDISELIQGTVQILSGLRLSKEAVITDINASVYPAAGAANERAPYIIIRDTNLVRAQEIATAINKQLNKDVEVELLAGFLPKKTSG